MDVCNAHFVPQAVDPKCLPRVRAREVLMQEVVLHRHPHLKGFARKPE